MNIELVEVEIMLDQIIKNCLDQMQEFVNGVIFLISFLALRRRTGGFHMKTFKACYVATIGTFIGVLLVKILCIQNDSTSSKMPFVFKMIFCVASLSNRFVSSTQRFSTV